MKVSHLTVPRIAGRIFTRFFSRREMVRIVSVNEETITRAAALSYDPAEHDAPVLAAFGEGYLAQKIVSIAKESGIPILPDPSLASMLSRISVGDEISPELYEAVAKVLTFVSEIDRSYAEKIRQGYNTQRHDMGW